MSEIFEVEELAVLFDEEDEALPIGVAVNGEQYWISGDNAIKLADALFEAVGVAYVPGDGDYAVEVFRFAKAFGRTVQFRYAKGDGSVIEQRRVVPHEVQEVKGKLLVIGTDPDRDDDPRAYRLDRVKGEPSLA